MEPVEDSATGAGGRQAGGVGQAPELIEEAGGWSPGEEATGVPEGGIVPAQWLGGDRHGGGAAAGQRHGRG
jgi:hypothetical protein